MNQRIRVLQELGESFERAAATGARRGVRARGRAVAGVVPGVLAIGASVAVVLAVVLVAVLAGSASRTAGPVSPAGVASEQTLLGQYAILRRPQTAADRAQAGPPPAGLNRPRRSGGSGGVPGRRALSYSVSVSGLARYHDVPSLTRVTHIDGVTVAFFVEQRVPRYVLPTATVSGNDPRSAARATTRAALKLDEAEANAQTGYSLWVRVGRSGRAQPVPLPPAVRAGVCGTGTGRVCPGPGVRRRPRAFGNLDALYDVAAATLAGPGGRIVAIVPDGVARVSWNWPREFVSGLLSYEPAVTVSARVHDNVAIATAPARFTIAEQVEPETVVRYAADGHPIIRAVNPGSSPSAYLMTTWDGSTPGPETAQSRQAERDPSTPNRVVIPNPTPRVGAAIWFVFNVLLNHRTYFARVTGGPHTGCVAANPADPEHGPGYGTALHPGAEQTVRGDTYLDGAPAGVTRCPGTYRLSISVLGSSGAPDPPFGSATFTAR